MLRIWSQNRTNLKNPSSGSLVRLPEETLVGVTAKCSPGGGLFVYLFQKLLNPNQHNDMDDTNKSTANVNDTVAETIIWWKAFLCGLVVLSFFAYMALKNELNVVLPTILAYPYYGLCIWCFVFVSKKKIIFRNKS